MPALPVVSNTSPLIKLVGVGLLDLLPQLYDQIWIPDVVHTEYHARVKPGDPDLNMLSWLFVKPVTIDASLTTRGNLGAGEAAAITLAQTSHVKLVILDDKRGRHIALRHGIAVIGTLGVLVTAKQNDLIPAVRPVIDRMIAQGRHISLSLREQVLRAAGEH